MMVKRMTFKQFLFILPLLLILAVFSLYPIVSSFLYTVFDYRVYDQQYADMYLNEQFNTKVFNQDVKYLVRNLKDDATVLEGADAAAFTDLAAEIEAFGKPYADMDDMQQLDGETGDELHAFVDDTEDKIKALYAAHPNAEFYHADDMQVLLDEMRTAFVASNFVGAQNYQRLLNDPRFFSALGTTAIFTVASVSIEFVLGLALAMIMNKAIKGIGLVRTTALIPWAIPTAVSALIWSYLYDGSSGIISRLFAQMGLIDAPQDMLLTSAGSMASAILADVWKTTPYMALLLLAGLQVIDRGLYESASIDGSGAVNTFFKITLPLLKPSILVALLFRMLDAFRVYDLLAILTKGKTESLSVYAYQIMIGQGYYGYGSVIVVAMFLVVAVIAFFFVKVMGAEVVGNDE